MGEHKPDNHTRQTHGSLPRHLFDPRTLEIHMLKRVWKLRHSQMKSGDHKAVQRSSCNSPILMPAYNRERKIMIYNLINTPNKAAILSGKSGMRPTLVSHHIWSSSRTCRRCPPSLWPSCREGASQQTADTSYNSNLRLQLFGSARAVRPPSTSAHSLPYFSGYYGSVASYCSFPGAQEVYPVHLVCPCGAFHQVALKLILSQ